VVAVKLTNLPEGVTDWSLLPAATIGGTSGTMRARPRQSGDVRMRLVEYGAGYLADHWCSKGHIIHVLAGSLAIEHEDGKPACMLSTGMSWHVADGEGPAHRVRSETGARVFIVD
jgi:hypothetical protein